MTRYLFRVDEVGIENNDGSVLSVAAIHVDDSLFLFTTIGNAILEEGGFPYGGSGLEVRHATVGVLAVSSLSPSS